MGDPALRIPSPSYSVDIESINGIALKSAEELPEVKALGKMKLEGVVRTSKREMSIRNLTALLICRYMMPKGSLQPMATEMTASRKCITTARHALPAVSVRAEGGRWKASVNMPPEIEKQLFTGTHSGIRMGRPREGRQTERPKKFYVYGIEPEVETDTVGPEVEYFYLNNERFETGSVGELQFPCHCPRERCFGNKYFRCRNRTQDVPHS